MKKSILLLLLLIGSIGTAQVKNNIKLNPIKSEIAPVDNVIKADVEKLNLAQVLKVQPKLTNRETFMSLKPNESWVISPGQLRNKDMYVESFYGEYSSGEIIIYPILLKEGSGTYYDFRYLKLKFRPEIGAEYRVKVQLAPGYYGNQSSILAKIGRYNTSWRVDDNRDEILIIYRAENNEIWLSNLLDRNSPEDFETLKIKKIEIDKVQ